MRRSVRQLDQLLARGGVGGPAYDRIFEQVVDAVTERRRIARILVPVTALATVLGALALLGRAPSDPFRSKGRDLGGPAIEIGCARSRRPVCRLGDTLMFESNGTTVSGYLAAYAERVGNNDLDARIWYFPTVGGESPIVNAGARPVVLGRGIRIGEEHDSGDYRVTVILSAQPLRRADVERSDLQSLQRRTVLDLHIDP